MRGSCLLALSVLLTATVGRSGSACLTTLSSSAAFSPPAPYDGIAPAGTFWYGTDALWTQLDAGGVWHLKGNVDQHGGYATKLVFWRRGFDWRKEPEPKLILTARRVDGDAPPVAVAHANAVFVTGNIPAMLTGIRIPTAGCWEVSGHYGGATVTFTVSVEP